MLHLRRWYPARLSDMPYHTVVIETYKIYADDKLRFAAVAALNLSHLVASVVLSRHRCAAIAIGRIVWLELLQRVSRWLRLIHALLLLRVLLLSRVAVATAGVDRWWRHWTRRSTLIRMSWRTQVTTLLCVLV
jgi:hypothetical protein